MKFMLTIFNAFDTLKHRLVWMEDRGLSQEYLQDHTSRIVSGFGPAPTVESS